MASKTGGPSAPGKDPYELLSVSRDSTAMNIKIAYRKLALNYWPGRMILPDIWSVDLTVMFRADWRYLEWTRYYGTSLRSCA
ncbi:hypothetical protein Nepgr_003753 [Nepenthes gracilis]|uniref:J domain-containing protein n=1 Tax=Nepenthes gracilis TaxID=150966 RepID=A0AAD3S046_NEPGR|nr:hypothetical protein Nepgr_003753 [Nepenthes gracilis]